MSEVEALRTEHTHVNTAGCCVDVTEKEEEEEEDAEVRDIFNFFPSEDYHIFHPIRH